MTRAPKIQSQVSRTVSEERRVSTGLLNDWLAEPEKQSDELQANQARLLKILAKKALH
ncbi:MAG TPA: hypothetical protein VGI91_09160 [Steroidobacteraceae bacterium]|jgi:hypothetical protein